MKNNFLSIGTTGTTTKFLTEAELPDCARLTGSPEEEHKAIEESTKIAEEMDLKSALERSMKNLSNDGAGPSNTKPATATTQSSNPSLTILPTDKFTESDVAEIMKIGFTRDKVIHELRNCNGDKTQAMAALFAKSLKF